jgi:hypothetical protein
MSRRQIRSEVLNVRWIIVDRANHTGMNTNAYFNIDLLDRGEHGEMADMFSTGDTDSIAR